ncbi:MAG: hypothetical protein ACK559_30650, partial [bacterium]
VFITQILNPIIRACTQYDEGCKDGMLRWWNKDQNMVVDSQFRIIEEKENNWKPEEEVKKEDQDSDNLS